MKIFSFRFKKLIISEFLLVLFAVFSIILIFQTENVAASEDNVIKSKVIDFLSENGHVADINSFECNEIVFFEERDAVFNDYKQMQLEQGFDVSQYCGKNVTKCTLLILNHPEVQYGTSVYANVYLFDEKIIAADIFSVAVDGFIEGVIK